jgi:hypothetical protein
VRIGGLVAFGGPQKVGHVDAEGRGHGGKTRERDVSLTVLELGQEADRKLGSVGELALAEAEARAPGANVVADLVEKPRPHIGTILPVFSRVKQ